MGIQVAELTDNKVCHEKQFIDFEFDGKHISEFGMVAVFDGDRHSFSSTSNFDDEVSDVAGVNGQYFWGTKIKSLEKTFSLATDGMSEKQINAFKKHFIPGRYGKFIECAAENRYSYARISKPIEFKVIPFKKSITIGDKTFYVTEYKGEATIDFVFDDPYSYAITKRFENSIKEATPAQLKIAYEDGIPFSDSQDDIIIQENNVLYYNPSNAAARPIITLKVSAPFEDSIIAEPPYNYVFKDDINSPDEPYSVITSFSANWDALTEDGALEWEKTDECKFSAPDVFYSYNKILQIIKNYSKTDKIELQDKLREEITHSKVLVFALAKLNDSSVSSIDTLNDNWKLAFYKLFYGFFTTKDSEPFLTLTLNSKTNEAKIEYYIKDSEGNTLLQKENCGEIMRSPYLKLEGGDSLLEQRNILLQREPFMIGTYHGIDFTNSLGGLSIEESGGSPIEFEYTYI